MMSSGSDFWALPTVRLTPGTLWSQVETQTRHAIACQALHSIQTYDQPLPTAKIPFVVRMLANIKRKEQVTAQAPPDFNPFLPCDPDLLVADLSDRHRCVLNKFNASPHHILLVTQTFEPQTDWLTAADWLAVGLSWQERDALMFYNSGDPAGASQRHKHLQLLPLPLTDTAPRVPIEAIFDQIAWSPQPAAAPDPDGRADAITLDTLNVGTIATLPFHHAIARLPWSTWPTATAAAPALAQIYRTLLAAVNIHQPAADFWAPPAYNCLATREWMMVIPRSQSQYHAIGINALGFAGTFLVRDAAQLDRLQSDGIMTALTAVAIAR